MSSFPRNWGLRSRLVAAILAVAVVVLGGSFIALHERTDDEIRTGVDERLRADLAEFMASPASSARTPSELIRRGRDFIADQGYQPDSPILTIRSAGEIVSNQEGLLEEVAEHAGEHSEGESSEDDEESGLLGAPVGLATVDLGDDGELRVLTYPVVSGGRSLGTFRAAESLEPVGFAEGSLKRTLLLIGAISLVVLVAAALWIATVIAKPLRSMADFAAEIEPGDLDRRIEIDGGPTEVRVLASAFNRMLDRLQRSFQRERDFVADASHELRTPVTIAQGELELLRRDADLQQGERIDVVLRELQRMERLTADMLTLATAESRENLRIRRVPVRDMLDDLRRDLPLMGPRDYTVDDVAGTVDADGDRIAQVFRNLASNAVAHTDPGGTIAVSAQPLGDRIRFTVTDDGDGIPEGEADRLFDRFYRTDPGRTREGGGSGLGLAIARSIVEAHGGWIGTCPSESGGCVAFELPGYSP